MSTPCTRFERLDSEKNYVGTLELTSEFDWVTHAKCAPFLYNFLSGATVNREQEWARNVLWSHYRNKLGKKEHSEVEKFRTDFALERRYTTEERAKELASRARFSEPREWEQNGPHN